MSITLSIGQGDNTLSITNNGPYNVHFTVLDTSIKRSIDVGQSFSQVLSSQEAFIYGRIFGQDTPFIPIQLGLFGNTAISYVSYFDGKKYITNRGVVNGYSVEIELYKEALAKNINISTLTPGTTISANITGTYTTITNTPTTVTPSENIIIDVGSHMPKDSYAMQINNGQNMKNIVDGTTVYNNFPAVINLNANKTITANGMDTPTITVNYTNTTEPVITNT